MCGGRDHIRSCRVLVFMLQCLLSRQLYMCMIMCGRVCIRTWVWGGNISQSGLVLVQSSLFCSSGPLGLLLHSHQHPLGTSDHLWAVCGPPPSLHFHPWPLNRGQPSPFLEGPGQAEVKHSLFRFVFIFKSFFFFSIKFIPYSYV